MLLSRQVDHEGILDSFILTIWLYISLFKRFVFLLIFCNLQFSPSDSEPVFWSQAACILSVLILALKFHPVSAVVELSSWVSRYPSEVLQTSPYNRSFCQRTAKQLHPPSPEATRAKASPRSNLLWVRAWGGAEYAAVENPTTISKPKSSAGLVATCTETQTGANHVVVCVLSANLRRETPAHWREHSTYFLAFGNPQNAWK